MDGWVDSDRFPRTTIGRAIGLTVGDGIDIELWRSTIPTRYFTLGDATAAAIGGMQITPWYGIHNYVEFRPVDPPVRD